MIDRFPTQNPRAMTVCYFFFHEKVVIHDIRRKNLSLRVIKDVSIMKLSCITFDRIHEKRTRLRLAESSTVLM